MQLVGVTLAALASLAAAESLKKLDTSLTILTNNDLQGTCSVPLLPRLSLTFLQEPRAPMRTRP
jgi:hypothetical protein